MFLRNLLKRPFCRHEYSLLCILPMLDFKIDEDTAFEVNYMCRKCCKQVAIVMSRHDLYMDVFCKKIYCKKGKVKTGGKNT
jgi:RNase P subunit RPR2